MAKVQPQYYGVFGNIDFEPYRYQEYPKVVGYRDEKKKDPIIVADPKEEVDFITTGSKGAYKTREDELNEELEKRALELRLAQEELKKIKDGQTAAKAAVEKKA